MDLRHVTRSQLLAGTLQPIQRGRELYRSAVLEQAARDPGRPWVRFAFLRVLRWQTRTNSDIFGHPRPAVPWRGQPARAEKSVEFARAPPLGTPTPPNYPDRRGFVFHFSTRASFL